MELGVASFACYKQELVSCLPLFAQFDIRYMELWTFSSFANPLHFRYKDEDYLDNFSALLLKYNLRVSSIHAPIESGLDISSPNPASREEAIKETIKAIDAVVKLGGRTLVVHPGGKSVDREKQLRIASESLQIVESYCQGLNIRLTLENMLPGYVGSRLEDLEYLLTSLSPRAGICLDTGHGFLNGNLFELMRTLGARIYHLHIQDTHTSSDEHLLPFQGEIDWEEFMVKLSQIHYKGVFMTEIREAKDNSLEAILAGTRCVFEKLASFSFHGVGKEAPGMRKERGDK